MIDHDGIGVIRQQQDNLAFPKKRGKDLSYSQPEEYSKQANDKRGIAVIEIIAGRRGIIDDFSLISANSKNQQRENQEVKEPINP
jgi:hypothetical protein